MLGLITGGAHLSAQTQQSAKQPLPTLTTTHDVHSLTIEQDDDARLSKLEAAQAAAAALDIALTGTVTYYNPYVDPRRPAFFVADASGAIFVSMPPQGFKPGDRVEITGVSEPGDYAPIVKGTEAHVIGTASLPATGPAVSLTQLLTGAYDGQWVELKGLVQAVRKKPAVYSLP